MRISCFGEVSSWCRGRRFPPIRAERADSPRPPALEAEPSKAERHGAIDPARDLQDLRQVSDQIQLLFGVVDVEPDEHREIDVECLPT